MYLDVLELKSLLHNEEDSGVSELDGASPQYSEAIHECLKHFPVPWIGIRDSKPWSHRSSDFTSLFYLILCTRV
jgi:hypothetical protein